MSRIVYGKGQHLFTFTWSVDAFEGDVASDPIELKVAGNSLVEALKQVAKLDFPTLMGQPDSIPPINYCSCSIGTTCENCIKAGRGHPGGIKDFKHEHVWGDVERVGETPITAEEVGGGIGARPLDVIGSRAILGQRCVCGEKRIMTEAEIAEWKEAERLRIIEHNEIMAGLETLDRLQKWTVDQRKKAVYHSWVLDPDNCPYCGGEGVIDDESACSDPDCCPSQSYVCQACNPRGEAA